MATFCTAAGFPPGRRPSCSIVANAPNEG